MLPALLKKAIPEKRKNTTYQLINEKNVIIMIKILIKEHFVCQLTL